VQRLKLVKKTQGQSRNLERVIRFEAIRFADPDDGVDDPSASHVATFNFSFFATGWHPSLFISEERARGLYSCRLSFGASKRDSSCLGSLPCHRFLSGGQPNHHLLPSALLSVEYNTLQQRPFLNLYRIAICRKLDAC
jgi:hypothetical protein